MMTHAQAIRLAITIMQEQIRRLAVDANMAELLGADYAAARSAARERSRLQEAIGLLEHVEQAAREQRI